MHRASSIPMEVALGGVRGEQVQDTRTRISNTVIAGEGRLGCCGVRMVFEGVWDGAGVAVEFFEVAALWVLGHFEGVD